MGKKVLYSGKFVNFVFDEDTAWEYADRRKISGIVAIVARTENNEVLFVEQYRPPCGGPVIEFPAGLAGDHDGDVDEALEAAAGRELEEETGFRADHFEFLSEGPSSAGITSEVIRLYWADGVRQVGPGGGNASENEHIKVHKVPADQIDAWLAQKTAEGLQVDLKVYAGLYFLKQHIEK